MNPLLIRRRGMMAGKVLPYDAEVEYLRRENGVSAYIDTGIVPNDLTGIWLYVEPTNTVDSYLCGMRKDSGNTRFIIGYTNNNAYYGWGAYNGSLTNTFTKGELSLNYLNSRRFKVKQEGGTELQSNTFSTLPFSTTLTIFLFGYNRYGSFIGASQHLYACKISQGSDIIRDFTPVRVGTVGYMYDRVSGQLFGNAGTGAFILGPDIQ